MKRGDTRNPLVILLSYEDGTSPDLDGVAARFIMLRYPDGELIVDADTTEGLTLDNVTKTATYSWQPGDVDQVGVFTAEVELTVNNQPETFPSRGAIVLTIEPDLG